MNERVTISSATSRAFAKRSREVSQLQTLQGRATHISISAIAATETLALLGLPAALLSPQHRVLAVNALFGMFIPSVIRKSAAGRIHLNNQKADQLFISAITNARLGDAMNRQAKDAGIFSIPLPAEDDRPAMVVHVVPLMRAARDIFAAATSLIIITPVCRSNVPSASVIQGLFDLSGAEARIAHSIAAGETINEIAAGAKKSEGTIRTQLKSVFSKTGISRQGDLISLLGNINPVRPLKD